MQKNELLYYDECVEEDDNLPVPVHTYIRPYMGHQFILHIILSLGIFGIEVDLTIHRTLKDALRYAKLIGTDDEKESLK